MSDLIRDLRGICGHDSRSVEHCVTCEAADRLEGLKPLFPTRPAESTLQPAVGDDHNPEQLALLAVMQIEELVSSCLPILDAEQLGDFEQLVLLAVKRGLST